MIGEGLGGMERKEVMRIMRCMNGTWLDGSDFLEYVWKKRSLHAIANFVSIVAAIRSSFLTCGIFRLQVFREITTVCPGSPTFL
jgi:hypothetical protein